MKVRAKCINDNNKPIEIPLNKWIKKDSEYNIIHIHYHVNQGVQGVSLAEIDLSGVEKYSSFKFDRFAIHKDDIDKLIELFKLCTDLNDVNINELIEQLEVEYSI